MTSRWDSLSSWHDDWAGLAVTVMGADARGFAVADTLTELGADVTVIAEAATSRDMLELLTVINARVALADDPDASSRGTEVIVVTSQFGTQHPLLGRRAVADVPIVSDLELAWRLRDKSGPAAPWLLATGGDGAGRAAHLTEAMLLAAGRRVVACGDTAQGIPVLDVLRVPDPWEVVVVAVSGEDLERTSSISGWAAACLESQTQHEHSSAGLARVYDGTQVACVYNRDDLDTMAMVEDADVEEGCRAIGFGLGIPGPSDFGLVEGILCDRAFLDDRRSSALEFGTLDILASAGLRTHREVREVLAAAALARSFDAPVAAVAAALRGLAADEH